MSIEGVINICLSGAKTGGPNGQGVKITSSRRTNIASFLVGKHPLEAKTILPAIFSVCGSAHSHASAMAHSQVHMGNKTKRAGDLIILCENAREHMLRIFTGWNLDKLSDLIHIPFHEVMAYVRDMQIAVSYDTEGQHCFSQASRLKILELANNINAFIETNILNCDSKKWLAITDTIQLEKWAKQTDTLAGRFITTLYQNNWQSAGATKTSFLPSVSPKELAKEMHGEKGESFISAPEWDGKQYETGPFAKNHNHPLVAAIVEQYGAGLLARQIARLVELVKIPEKIKQTISDESKEESLKTLIGFAQVETARGQLTHSVQVKDDKITDYKILAPTEWNFHPKGVVRDSLNSLVESQSKDLKKLANMIIEAIDPCVAYEVRVN